MKRSYIITSIVLFVALFSLQSCDDKKVNLNKLEDDQLIEKLADNSWRTREAAQAEVVKRGDKIIAALRKAEGKGDAERNRRVRHAVDTICWNNYKVLVRALDISFEWAYNGENRRFFKQLIDELKTKIKQSQCDVKAIVEYVDSDFTEKVDGLPYGPEKNKEAKKHVLFFLSYFDQDEDKDGIMDQWEVKNGLDPSNKDDANEDPDGDGKSNKQEYKDGTNPYQKEE